MKKKLSPARLVASVTFLVTLATITLAQPPNLTPLSSETKSALIESLAKTLAANYVFPEQAATIGEHLKKQNQQNRFAAVTNPNDFANALVKEMRAVNNDKHLMLRYDPQLEARILKFLATKQPDTTEVAQEQRQNFFFKKLEILPSNIGYLEFTNFASPSPQARKTVRAAMEFLAHTDAVILDLRNNFGGNGAMGGEIASYFFKDKTYWGRSFNRIENKWADSWIENKKAITGGLALNQPIYILTSNRTFSAAEGLAYTLQQLRGATVVGETTRGGAHLTRSFSLGNGFVGFIPYTRGENAKTKTDWEGVGVIPALKESSSNSLLAAQKAILNQQLSVATDEKEKRKIQWLLNFYQAKTSSLTINPTELAKFVGQFEEFEFSLTDNEIVCKNTHQANKSDKLKPISATLFQIDNDAQVEFIADKTGQYTTIKLYWSDGWVDTIARTR